MSKRREEYADGFYWLVRAADPPIVVELMDAYIWRAGTDYPLRLVTWTEDGQSAYDTLEGELIGPLLPPDLKC